MTHIAETSFDYLQEAASPILDLDGSDVEDNIVDDEDEVEDLRNLTTSSQNPVLAESEPQGGDAAFQSPARGGGVNESTELFYSAASAVSACLTSSPERKVGDKSGRPVAALSEASDTAGGDSNPTTEGSAMDGSAPTDGAAAVETSGLQYNMMYPADDFEQPLMTPAANSAVSEAKSFVNGLLSPFSPILTKENLPRDERTECMQFVSLQPCRKVSVVVRVLSLPEGYKGGDGAAAAQRCVFPHYRDERQGGNASAEHQSPIRQEGDNTGTEESTPSSKQVILPRDMVVVNPTAFGKFIPSQVTLETAKLVAQVANVASEDWARLYEFHHVMWPSTSESADDGESGTNLSNSKTQYNTMDALSRAVSQDALVEHQSSLLISLGQEASCIGSDSSDREQFGLWTMILNHCQALVETKGMLRLSMVEVLEDKPDSFRDLLFYSYRQQQQLEAYVDDSHETSTGKPVITLRHPDMTGAVFEGLTEVSIDSMPALLESLARRRRRRNNKSVTSSTVVIGILKYWDSAVSYELGRSPSSEITCVELSNGNQKERVRSESIIHRKSTVSLGQALRQLLLHSSIASKAIVKSGADQENVLSILPAVSFRETTLTKVLQRAMESSKICLVASISPLSEDYEQTITTLNYLRRLLVPPGKMAASPFKPSKNPLSGERAVNVSFASSLSSKAATQAEVLALSARKNNEKLQELAHQKGMLETLIADPRQRLAKVLKTSPARQAMDTMFEFQSSYDKDDEEEFLSNGSSHNYQPTNYMHELPSARESLNDGHPKVDAGSNVGNISLADTESRLDEASPNSQKLRTGEELRLKPQDEFDKEQRTEWASEEEVEKALQYEVGVLHSMFPDESCSDEETERLPADGFTDTEYVDREVRREKIIHHTLPSESIEENEVGSDFYEETPSFDDGYYGIQSPVPATHNSAENAFVNGRDIVDTPNRKDIGIEDAVEDDVDEDDITLGLTPLESDEIQNDLGLKVSESLVTRNFVREDDRTPMREEEWQQIGERPLDINHNQTEEFTLYSAGTVPPAHVEEYSSEQHATSVEDPHYHSNDIEPLPVYDEQDSLTEYDLPQEPLPMNESMISQASPPAFVDHLSESRVHLANPEKKRSAFSSFTQNASTRRAPATEGINALSRERKKLNSTVEALQHNLRRASEDHHEHLQQYEEEVHDLRARLEEALDDKRDYEKLANEAMSTQASIQEEFSMFTQEREELRSTVESLRDKMTSLSANHEEQLRRYQEEIESNVNSQRALERIADDALTAHEAQMEETRVLMEERDALKANTESLQTSLNASLEGNSDQIQKYHYEIRELHQKLEATIDEKRAIQIAADKARFDLESQTEKSRTLMVERDQLYSSLESFKGNAKKVSGEHHDHLLRFKEEIQQLHLDLDKSLSEKLAAEKKADNIRFSNDDLKRRLKIADDELASFRVANSRLELLRREDQDTIGKLTAEIRQKDSERIDVEHLKNELLRLKQNKGHLEDMTARRQSEFAERLRKQDSEVEHFKGKSLVLQDEIAALTEELNSEKRQKEEILDKVHVYQDKVTRITRDFSTKEEEMSRLQTKCDRLEKLRKDDHDKIRSLNMTLRQKDEDQLVMEKLKEKLLRLSENRDHLERLIKTRKAEYEHLMKERSNEVSVYADEVQSLKKKLQAAKDANQKHREEAKAQFRALQEGESSLVQAVQQRDDMIERLKVQLSITNEEIHSVKKRENTEFDNASREINMLRQRIGTLEEDLSSARKALDSTVAKSQNESREHKNLLGELERERDETRRQKTALERLHEEVAARQRESLRLQEKMFEMESALRRFQRETKDKVGSMIGQQQVSSSALETTRHENQALLADVGRLERLVERLQRERDACFESLRTGQRKLSELSSKNHMAGPLDDVFGSSFRMQKDHRLLKSDSTAARSKRPVLPEIYITDYSVGERIGPGLSLRAEEIAACVAISAKNSLQESHDETSQLRSQIHRLEEERTVEVSALKSKVQKLERELSQQYQPSQHYRSDVPTSRYSATNTRRHVPYSFEPVE